MNFNDMTYEEVWKFNVNGGKAKKSLNVQITSISGIRI